MIIPSEILLQVLKEAAYVLSLSELFQARLVNQEFADEILSLRITTTFLDKQLRRWATFPESIRRRYLRQKIKQHAKTPCVFSYFIHEVLDSNANVLNTEAGREGLIDKILDAVQWESWNLPSWMLLTYRYNLWVKRHKENMSAKLNTPYEDMSIAIVCSAIKRGNITELDSVLKQGHLPLHKWCHRWGVLPLHFAAQHGTKEVIKVLIRHGVPRHYYLGYHYRYALAVAAQNNNEGALEAWVENPNPPLDCRYPNTVCNHHVGVSLDLRKSMRTVVREGNMEMIRFIEKQFPRDMGMESLLFEGVTVAIQYGLPDVIRHFLELGGFDIHMHTESFFKGLLMTAILDCNAKTRPQVVRLLLEYGVNPNQTFSEGRQRVSGTPLQRAILREDVETMRALVEYGADVNATSVGRHGRSNAVCSLPPLILAMRRRSAEMVRILLENRANRMCLSRRQTLLMKTGKEKLLDDDIVIWNGMDQGETYSFVVVKQRPRKRKVKKLDN
ncbi:isoform Er9 of ankyrin-1 [Aspergillus udagawae]|nr:isoform Er9 of ankyrin-1 [Aspergillus udagawae]